MKQSNTNFNTNLTEDEVLDKLTKSICNNKTALMFKGMAAAFGSVAGERINLTRKECLAKGMSAKEYRIQKALGSLPTKPKYSFIKDVRRK